MVGFAPFVVSFARPCAGFLEAFLFRSVHGVLSLVTVGTGCQSVKLKLDKKCQIFNAQNVAYVPDWDAMYDYFEVVAMVKIRFNLQMEKGIQEEFHTNPAMIVPRFIVTKLCIGNATEPGVGAQAAQFSPFGSQLAPPEGDTDSAAAEAPASEWQFQAADWPEDA
jgi:hypothetical protein